MAHAHTHWYAMIEEYKALKDVPNAFYFQRVKETDRASYLVRPYLYSSLYDRIRYLFYRFLIAACDWLYYSQHSTLPHPHWKKVDCLSAAERHCRLARKKRIPRRHQDGECAGDIVELGLFGGLCILQANLPAWSKFWVLLLRGNEAWSSH